MLRISKATISTIYLERGQNSHGQEGRASASINKLLHGLCSDLRRAEKGGSRVRTQDSEIGCAERDDEESPGKM